MACGFGVLFSLKQLESFVYFETLSNVVNKDKMHDHTDPGLGRNPMFLERKIWRPVRSQRHKRQCNARGE